MTEFSQNEERLAELVGAIQDRMNNGEEVDLEEIKAEHPEFSSDLDSYFNCDHLFKEAFDDSELVVVPEEEVPLVDTAAFPIQRRLEDIALGTVHLLAKEKGGRKCDLVVLHPWITPEQRKKIGASVRHTITYQFEAFIPVFEFGQMNKVPFVLREYFGGQNLAQIMRGVVDGGGAYGLEATMFDSDPAHRLAPLSGSREEAASRLLTNESHLVALLNVFRAWSYALDQAHRRGLIHREVEPRNLSIDSDGQCAVGGSGLSWHGTGIDPSKMKHWCPNWLAPEVVDPSWGNVTWMADVYSLARGLAACLSLRMPDENDDPEDVLMRISVGDRTWLDEMPDELDEQLRALIEEATFPDQSRRLKSLALFGRRLAALVPEDKHRVRKGWAGRFFRRS